MVWIKSEGSLLETSFFLREFSLCSSQASTDWVRPTHTEVGTLLYPEFTILTLISSKNTLQIDT